MAGNVFYECNKLKDITIPESTSFGADVFSYTESNHSIVPCPIFFKISSEDQDSAIVHGLHFTEDGELEIVFREYAVQIPVKFADGKTVLQLVYDFEVSIITQDEEVSPIEANIGLGKAGEDDVLLFSLKFDVDTIPKTIRCKRNGEFIDLNPVSWRPYEEWERA